MYSSKFPAHKKYVAWNDLVLDLAQLDSIRGEIGEKHFVLKKYSSAFMVNLAYFLYYPQFNYTPTSAGKEKLSTKTKI